jgi:hypothetical protein
MPRLTVKNHQPVQWSITIIALSALVALITWLLLDKSHWSLIYDRMSANRDYNHLAELHRELQQENNQLKEQILMMERTAELDRETASLLQADVQKLQDEIYQLKGELKFYNNIMDATRESTGLNIQGMYIESLPQAHSYRMKLVLTHVAKGVKQATGTLQVTVEGMRDGVNSRLDLQEVSLDETLDMSFNFRNFKRFESDVKFPDGFSPRRVLVQLQPSGGKRSIIKKVFDWPEVTG